MTLQEILRSNGLTDEQVEKITSDMKTNKIFTSSEENLDIRYGKLKGEFDTLTEAHGRATTLIEELKANNGDNKDLQDKVNTYETQIDTLKNELSETKKENAIKVALLNAKATDIDYLSYKLKENDLKLTADGEISGLNDLITNLKTQYPNHFESTSDKKFEINKMNNGNGDDTDVISKEDFSKMGYKERLTLYNENEELYNELSGKEK
ncbi:MAG: phage scaffolding protein [Eubacterium sp.]|nr:phage scaffolding protein [Eubacterium sp.]